MKINLWLFIIVHHTIIKLIKIINVLVPTYTPVHILFYIKQWELPFLGMSCKDDKFLFFLSLKKKKIMTSKACAKVEHLLLSAHLPETCSISYFVRFVSALGEFKYVSLDFVWHKLTLSPSPQLASSVVFYPQIL